MGLLLANFPRLCHWEPMPEDPSGGPIVALSTLVLLIQLLQKASLGDTEQDRDG
jgi:hypothetical protein